MSLQILSKFLLPEMKFVQTACKRLLSAFLQRAALATWTKHQSPLSQLMSHHIGPPVCLPLVWNESSKGEAEKKGKGANEIRGEKHNTLISISPTS